MYAGANGKVQRKDRLRRDVGAAQLAGGVAAYAIGAEIEDVFLPTRGDANAALARRLAMYLTHVGFEMSLSRVAAAFGRDRSTVSHACHRIEELRDDAAFDAWLDAMEAALRGAPPPLETPALLRRALEEGKP
ncbi:MAG: helix-turn-helix domain-containing protein [Hyphomonadaceae bacterium]